MVELARNGKLCPTQLCPLQLAAPLLASVIKLLPFRNKSFSCWFKPEGQCGRLRGTLWHSVNVFMLFFLTSWKSAERAVSVTFKWNLHVETVTFPQTLVPEMNFPHFFGGLPSCERERCPDGLQPHQHRSIVPTPEPYSVVLLPLFFFFTRIFFITWGGQFSIKPLPQCSLLSMGSSAVSSMFSVVVACNVVFNNLTHRILMHNLLFLFLKVDSTPDWSFVLNLGLLISVGLL